MKSKLHERLQRDKEFTAEDEEFLSCDEGASGGKGDSCTSWWKDLKASKKVEAAEDSDEDVESNAINEVKGTQN